MGALDDIAAGAGDSSGPVLPQSGNFNTARASRWICRRKSRRFIRCTCKTSIPGAA